MLWSESSIATFASTVTPGAEPTPSASAEPSAEPVEEVLEEPSEEPSVTPTEELSAKVTYNMQLLVTTQKQKECYIPIKIKPTQSAIKLSTSTKSITLYKQVKDTDAPEIQISAVSGAKPPKNLVIKNVSAGNKDFNVAYAAESGSMKLTFANDAAKAKYKAKATVKVPVYIQVEDQASDVTVKTEITVTVKN